MMLPAAPERAMANSDPPVAIAVKPIPGVATVPENAPVAAPVRTCPDMAPPVAPPAAPPTIEPT